MKTSAFLKFVSIPYPHKCYTFISSNSSSPPIKERERGERGLFAPTLPRTLRDNEHHPARTHQEMKGAALCPFFAGRGEGGV